MLTAAHRRVDPSSRPSTNGVLPSGWMQMPAFRSSQQLRRWTLTLILAVAAAFAIHFARVHPWHRFYLAKSKTLFIEKAPPRPISNADRCFKPKEAFSESASTEVAAPIGSFEEAGLDRQHCFHYASRFQPYLTQGWGNSYITKAQERLGLLDKTLITNDLVWYANLLAEHEPDTYPHVDWSNISVSEACSAHNTEDSPAIKSTQVGKVGKRSRVAFVLRCYQDLVWTQDAILHLRALIWELRSSSLSFDLDVHILLEVKDAASYVSMFSPSGRRQILRGSVPIEFWSLVTMWSESEMMLRYPLYGDFRTGIAAAGSYRGCLLPLQRFAVEHPEYDSIVNWEMDTRFTHTYDQLLEAVHAYAYRARAQTYTRWPVGGRVDPSDGFNEGCINKKPDVVVFSPVRNPQGSGWYWEYDVQGYQSMQSTARGASVGTNLWLSRRALLALENVTASLHQSLFCEAMAPSLAFRSPALSHEAGEDQCDEQFKLVHYPHPVAFRYEASSEKIDRLVNPRSSVLSKRNEEVLKDTSYYYSSNIVDRIYLQWQSQPDSCIKPLLLHPIKSLATQPSLAQRHGLVRRVLGTSKEGPLCAASTISQCVDLIEADTQRYLGRKFTPKGHTTLRSWDLQLPRYISKRTWIMNSSSRALVQTIAILILAAIFGRLLVDGLASRRPGTSRGEYIALGLR